MAESGWFHQGFSPCSMSSAGALDCSLWTQTQRCDLGCCIGSLSGKPAKNLARDDQFYCGAANHSLVEMTYMNHVRTFALLFLTTALVAQAANAQIPAKDPSARLREVLPADVAQRVLARIADARAHQLPAEALENRALKFAAKGVDPRSIERSVNEQALRMESAKSALASGRGSNPAGDEIEAGAEAMRKGVDGPSVASFAKSAPRNRSLAVPLFVIGSLADHGLPVDQALKQVLARLAARASDSDLESLPGELPPQAIAGQANRPAETGRDFGQSHKPTTTGRPATAGPPAGIPGNAGKKSNPGQGHKPPPRN